MQILIWSAKGGVGKTAISACLFQYLKDFQIITNDKMNPYNLILKKEQYYLISDNQSIPIFSSKENLVYDLGGYGSKAIKPFIEQNKELIILIPFTPDVVSFQVAISVYNEIKNLNENIFFVLNRSKKGDYNIFKEQLKKMNINKTLFEIKESKLFQNIFNTKQSIKDVKSNKLLSHSYKTVFEQINSLTEGIK